MQRCENPVRSSVYHTACSGVGNFKSLLVWQRAFAFGLRVTRATEAFPRSERFGLTAQLRRAAVSVPSNIAEGSRRSGNGELLYFLGVARGSMGELECQLQFARELNYLTTENWAVLDREAQEISRMLAKLIRYLRLDQAGGRRDQKGASRPRSPTPNQ